MHPGRHHMVVFMVFIGKKIHNKEKKDVKYTKDYLKNLTKEKSSDGSHLHKHFHEPESTNRLYDIYIVICTKLELMPRLLSIEER